MRILIILSHQTPKQREPLLLFERCRRGGPLRPSRARHKQREVLPPLCKRPVVTVGAFPNRRLSRVSRPYRQLKTALDQPAKPTCDPVGARPRATRFVDSKGHSRFVLRILIILSHQTPKQREPLLLFERVGSHGWRIFQPWAFSCFTAPRSTQPALDQPLNPPAPLSGPDLARQGLLIPKDIPGSFCEF